MSVTMMTAHFNCKCVTVNVSWVDIVFSVSTSQIRCVWRLLRGCRYQQKQRRNETSVWGKSAADAAKSTCDCGQWEIDSHCYVLISGQRRAEPVRQRERHTALNSNLITACEAWSINRWTDRWSVAVLGNFSLSHS